MAPGRAYNVAKQRSCPAVISSHFSHTHPASDTHDHGLHAVSMTDRFDIRSAASFELMVHAAASPPERRARAVQQASLPIKLGGAGILNTTSLAAASHTASLLACWSRMHAWFPIFVVVDVLRDPCEWLSELRTEYASLRLRRGAIASAYDDFAKDLVHYCDGATTRPRFRPKDLQASATSVPPLHLIFGIASISHVRTLPLSGSLRRLCIMRIGWCVSPPTRLPMPQHSPAAPPIAVIARPPA